MKATLALAFTLLAACSLQKHTLFSGSASGGGQTSEASTSSGSSPTEDPNAERERMAEYHAQQGQSSLDEGAFLRHEFDALKGLTVADAKAKAKAFGHVGVVRVLEEDDFVEGCAAGIVCSATDERGGQSGMGDDDRLLLWTNKTVTISGPPE